MGTLSLDLLNQPPPPPYNDEIPCYQRGELPDFCVTSLDISHLTGSRHDKVMQSVDRLVKQGVMVLPPLGEVTIRDERGSMRKKKTFIFTRDCQRDSYIVIAQLSPVHTAKLVDRWMELERLSQERVIQNQAPSQDFLLDSETKEVLRQKIETHSHLSGKFKNAETQHNQLDEEIKRLERKRHLAYIEGQQLRLELEPLDKEIKYILEVEKSARQEAISITTAKLSKLLVEKS